MDLQTAPFSAAPHCDQICLEEGQEAAHERKKAKYIDPVAECREGGRRVRLSPVRVGGRRFQGVSTTCLPKGLWFRATRGL